MRAGDEAAPFSGAGPRLYERTGHRRYRVGDERAAF
jgi:hypothetical protein